MSSPAVQFRSACHASPRPRSSGLGSPSSRDDACGAARVPFVTLVSLVLLGGVIGLLALQHLHAAGVVRRHLAGGPGRARSPPASRRCAMELDVLRNPQHVAEQARKMGMVTAGTPAFLRLSDGKVLGQPAPPDPTQNVRIVHRPPAKPAVLNPRRPTSTRPPRVRPRPGPPPARRRTARQR